MSSENNPYAASGGNYAANVQFGATPEPVSAGPLIKDTTTASFPTDVVRESRNQPVLVDFWAPWCGPCKQLTPILEKMVQAAGGRVKLVKMNIDDHPSIAGQLGIQSIPAVIAFKDGQAVDGFMGAIPESKIAEFIEKVAGGDGGAAQIAEALTAAGEAQAAGDLQTAADIYAAVLEQAPDTIDAIAGLAGILFESGDIEGATGLMETAPEAKKDSPPLVALRARMALAQEVSQLGNPIELQNRLDANEKDHQARFDLALIQNAQGNRAEAADNLLFIVKTDRTWNDDGARAQLLQLFDAWGMADEVTLSTRRKLSSLLFS